MSRQLQNEGGGPGTLLSPEEDVTELQGLYNDLLGCFQRGRGSTRSPKPMPGFSQILAMITEVINDQNDQVVPIPTAVSVNSSNCNTPSKGSQNVIYSDIEEASISTHHGIVSDEDDNNGYQEDTEVDEIEDEEVFQDCEHQHGSAMGLEEKLFDIVSHFPRDEDLLVPPPIPRVMTNTKGIYREKDNHASDVQNNNDDASQADDQEYQAEKEAIIRHATSSLFTMPITKPLTRSTVAEQDLFRHFSTPKVVMNMTDMRDTLADLSLGGPNGLFPPGGDSGGSDKQDSPKGGESKTVTWADQQQRPRSTSSTVLMDRDSSSLAIGGSMLTNLLHSFRLAMPQMRRRNNDNLEQPAEMSGGDPPPPHQ